MMTPREFGSKMSKGKNGMLAAPAESGSSAASASVERTRRQRERRENEAQHD
jgi:hypothetical protein